MDSKTTVRMFISLLPWFKKAVFLFVMIPSLVSASNLAEIYKNRGNAFYQKRQYIQAVKEFSKAIEINHDYIEAYYNRGLAYYDLNLFYKAIVDFDMVLMLNPEVREAYLRRGLAYNKVNKLKLALADVKKAAGMGDPDAVKMLESGELALQVEKERRRQLNMRSIIDDKQKEFNREVTVVSLDNEFGGNTVMTTHSKGDPVYDGKDGVFKSTDFFNSSDELVKTVVFHTGAFNSVNGRNKTVLWYNPDSTLKKKEFFYTGKRLGFTGTFFYDSKGNLTSKKIFDKFGKEVKE